MFATLGRTRAAGVRRQLDDSAEGPGTECEARGGEQTSAGGNLYIVYVIYDNSHYA